MAFSAGTTVMAGDNRDQIIMTILFLTPNPMMDKHTDEEKIVCYARIFLFVFVLSRLSHSNFFLFFLFLPVSPPDMSRLMPTHETFPKLFFAGLIKSSQASREKIRTLQSKATAFHERCKLVNQRATPDQTPLRYEITSSF